MAILDGQTPKECARQAVSSLNATKYNAVLDMWRQQHPAAATPANGNGAGKPQPAKPSLASQVQPDARPAGAKLTPPSKKMTEEEFETKVDSILHHPTMSQAERQKGLKILDEQWSKGEVQLANR